MSTTKKLGFDARFKVTYNYYSMYHGYFNAICGLVGVDYKMHDTEYWERYHEGIFRYLIEISYSENHWADKLIKLAKQSTQSQSFFEPERFIFWFLYQANQIGTLTNFTDLKQVFREECRQCQKQ